MSAEDEDGSGAGATPPKGAITEPDTVAATSDNWNSTCDQQPQVKKPNKQMRYLNKVDV